MLREHYCGHTPLAWDTTNTGENWHQSAQNHVALLHNALHPATSQWWHSKKPNKKHQFT
jgi:hypothetical protein